MSAELFATTVALATTPPEASVTTPVIFPVVETCADEMFEKKMMASVTKRIARLRTLRVYENRAADTTPPPIGHNVLRGLPSPNGRAGLRSPEVARLYTMCRAPPSLLTWKWRVAKNGHTALELNRVLGVQGLFKARHQATETMPGTGDERSARRLIEHENSVTGYRAV